MLVAVEKASECELRAPLPPTTLFVRSLPCEGVSNGITVYQIRKGLFGEARGSSRHRDAAIKPHLDCVSDPREEEFAKGFLLMLIEQGVIPWNNAIWRATRDHSCKHLLTVLMDYADPEIEEVLVSIKSFEHRHESKMKLLDEMLSHVAY